MLLIDLKGRLVYRLDYYMVQGGGGPMVDVFSKIKFASSEVKMVVNVT